MPAAVERLLPGALPPRQPALGTKTPARAGGWPLEEKRSAYPFGSIEPRESPPLDVLGASFSLRPWLRRLRHVFALSHLPLFPRPLDPSPRSPPLPPAQAAASPAQASDSPVQAPAPPGQARRASVRAPASSRRSYRSSGRLVRSPERRDAWPRVFARPTDGRNGALPQAERAIGWAKGAIGARGERCVPFVSRKTLWKRRSATARGRAGFPEGAEREAERSLAISWRAGGRRRSCGRPRGCGPGRPSR
jgi:hypothetical protein